MAPSSDRTFFTSKRVTALVVAPSSDRGFLTAGRVAALVLSPVVILFASAARLLIISNHDTTTATTIASSTGVVGTLLGTVVPLLPPFLPAIVVFFVIFRRWGFALLTALFTALVSPMYTSSVKDGLRMAASSGREAWRDLWDLLPGLQGLVHQIVHIASIILGRIMHILGYALAWLVKFLRGSGVELNSQGPWPAVYELSADLMAVWNDWPLPVRVAAICTLAAFIWALCATPWDYFPKGGIFRVLQWVIKLKWPNTAVRILGIVVYSVCVASACGFFVLYVQNAYHVSFNKKGISEVVRRPWLPAEEIKLSSGDTLVGYTLSSSVGWHVVLLESTRTVKYLRATEVVERNVCHMTKPTEPSPPPLIEFEGIVPSGVPLCRGVRPAG